MFPSHCCCLNGHVTQKVRLVYRFPPPLCHQRLFRLSSLQVATFHSHSTVCCRNISLIPCVHSSNYSNQFPPNTSATPNAWVQVHEQNQVYLSSTTAVCIYLYVAVGVHSSHQSCSSRSALALSCSRSLYSSSVIFFFRASGSTGDKRRRKSRKTAWHTGWFLIK